MVGPPLTTAPHWATVSSASPQRPLQLQSEAGKTRLKATEEGSVALQAAKIISHQGYNILLSRWEHQQPKFFCIGSRKSSVRGIQNTTTAHQKCIVSSLAEMILPRSSCQPRHLFWHEQTSLPATRGRRSPSRCLLLSLDGDAWRVSKYTL